MKSTNPQGNKEINQKRGPTTGNTGTMSKRNDFMDAKDELVNRCLVIEKEQHNETWDSAHQAGRFEGKGIAEPHWQTFETYWDETFKSE